MPVSALPAINQAVCSSWSQQDQELYNKYDRYLVQREVKFRNKYSPWKRVFGRQKWEQNKGYEITSVIQEPVPQKRQFAFPVKLSVGTARKDVVQHRERTVISSLCSHKFESPVFSWLPSFVDFIGKRANKNVDNVFKQQEDFQWLYYRGHVFHHSPTMFFCGGTDMVDDGAPVGDGNEAGTGGKSLAYLQAKVATMTGTDTHLSIRNLFAALNVLEEDLLATPWQSGTVKDDNFLNDKFLLITSNETFNSFIDDPWLKENKADNLNIVTDGFKGQIHGRITCATASNPLRFHRDGDGVISWPEPETIEENPAAPNFGQTVKSTTAKAAEYEVSFLVGGDGYDIIDPGPPPGDFSANADLMWNGRPRITDQVIIPCTDSEDVTQYDLNVYGEVLKVISMIVVGITGVTVRNVMPIIHKRKRYISTAL